MRFLPGFLQSQMMLILLRLLALVNKSLNVIIGRTRNMIMFLSVR